MKDNIIKLCLVGFGNSSREFCRILLERKEEIATLTGKKIEVVAVATKSRGNLANLAGLDLKELLNLSEKGRGFDSHPGLVQLETVDVINASGADVLIELSTLSIKDGQPALTHLETALNRGMHIITANKGPIAWGYKHLKEKADQKALQLLFESTVMDGTPIFSLVQRTLPDCRVEGFRGILNSTTNYILAEMENGLSYQAALQKAQDQDFVEADPDLDTRGWDAAAKTAVLINVLMGGNINPTEIDRTGIDNITLDQVQSALKANKRYKLICEGYRKDGSIYGRVSPQLLALEDIFCAVKASSSILCLQTEMMGEICIVESNPEIRQTAYGIYSDLLHLIKLSEGRGC
jgi:homoserine dehydrogenase